MNKTFIIAEAGVNHNGSLEMALRLIDVACAAGADAVKFQTFKAENIIAVNAPKADYQKDATGSDESQLEMVKKLELDETAHTRLHQHCQHKGIQFLSAPFDLESIDLLNRLGLEIFKIPSGEITNLPFLRQVHPEALEETHDVDPGLDLVLGHLLEESPNLEGLPAREPVSRHGAPPSPR